MTALLMLLGDFFGGLRGMTVMLFVGVAMNFFAYWNSDKMVLAHYDAQQVDRNSAPELYGIVEKLAKKANIPMPKVYIINSPVPNAFATGRNPEHAAVAVNTALADMLTKEELAGVLGHELSHVKHRDILVSTIAASMAGAISTIAQWGMFFGGGRDENGESRNPIASILVMILAPLAAMLIQMAVSRSREYMADKSGGELCGNPNALADALLKIEAYAERRVLKQLRICLLSTPLPVLMPSSFSVLTPQPRKEFSCCVSRQEKWVSVNNSTIPLSHIGDWVSIKNLITL